MQENRITGRKIKKMPIYEYSCNICGGTIEVLQKMSDPPIEKCEKCGGKMKRLISNTSFRLLGKGWYETDYKNTKKQTVAPT